jgi:hypothetical protein
MISSLNILLVLLLIGYIIFELVSVIKRTSSQIIIYFFVLFTLIHFGVSVGYSYFLDRLTMIHDPIIFYNKALIEKDWLGSFGFGNQFMPFLIYPLVQLNIRIEVLFFLFSTISFKGFLMYFEMLDLNRLKNNNRFLLLFYLLPTLHFWTGSLGKEALLVYLMAIFLCKLKLKSFDFSFVVLLLMIFLIRPHVFFVLILVFSVLFFMSNELDRALKIRMLLFVFLSVMVLLPLSLKFFLRIDILNFESLENYIFEFLDFTETNGGSSISLIDTNVISRILYLVFMPLPFLYDFKNKLQIIVSIENVFFLLGFLYTLFYFIKNGLKWQNLKYDLRFALMASLFLIILFGSYLYNLGLGNRMRIMFLPYIFYFFIGVLAAKTTSTR